MPWEALKPSVGGGSSQQSECEGVLNFIAAVVGLLLPICFIVKTEPAALLAAWEARDAARNNDDGGGSSSGIWGTLAAGCHRAEAAVEQSVRFLCGRSWLAGGPVPTLPALAPWERWMAVWLLTAVVWLWSVCAAALAAG